MPQYAFGPGSVPGSARAQITGAPLILGNGAVAGDGLGDITGYVTRINGVTETHGASLPIERVVTDPPELVEVPMTVWAIGYDGRVVAAVTVYVFPARAFRSPSAPGLSAAPGDLPGRISMTITDVPTFAGDAAVGGDGLGEITGYQTRIGGVLMTHNTTQLPIERLSGGHAEDAPVMMEWGLSASRVASARAASITPVRPRLPTSRSSSVSTTRSPSGDSSTRSPAGGLFVLDRRPAARR